MNTNSCGILLRGNDWRNSACYPGFFVLLSTFVESRKMKYRTVSFLSAASCYKALPARGHMNLVERILLWPEVEEFCLE